TSLVRAIGAIRKVSASSGLDRLSTPSITTIEHMVQLWAPPQRVGQPRPNSLATRKTVWPSLTSSSMPSGSTRTRWAGRSKRLLLVLLEPAVDHLVGVA